MTSKIALDSLMGADEQAAEYRRVMGEEAARRQALAADVAAGRCTCTPSKLRRKWDGESAPRVRTVHAADCPKREPWTQL